jgi:hypothetical protein
MLWEEGPVAVSEFLIREFHVFGLTLQTWMAFPAVALVLAVYLMVRLK